MPHQCLKCGQIFEEGSSQLLRGCPTCKGNRFFYTKEPLDTDKRNAITKEMNGDIKATIIKLLGEEHKDILNKTDNQINVKDKKNQKTMEKHENDREKTQDIKLLIDDNHRISVIKKLEAETTDTNTPETIDIVKPGRYKIDLKGLLEEEPIVIQKDGSYTIHLPSIFKMIKKE